VRFRDDNPADLVRARAAVSAWREQNPAGSPEEMVAAIGLRFRHDWAPVLRAVLYVVDKHSARGACGMLSGTEGAPR
jgi:hypothetical protein